MNKLHRIVMSPCEVKESIQKMRGILPLIQSEIIKDLKAQGGYLQPTARQPESQ